MPVSEQRKCCKQLGLSCFSRIFTSLENLVLWLVQKHIRKDSGDLGILESAPSLEKAGPTPSLHDPSSRKVRVSFWLQVLKRTLAHSTSTALLLDHFVNSSRISSFVLWIDFLSIVSLERQVSAWSHRYVFPRNKIEICLFILEPKWHSHYLTFFVLLS